MTIAGNVWGEAERRGEQASFAAWLGLVTGVVTVARL